MDTDPGEAAALAAPRLTLSVVEALWQRILLPLRPRSWRYSMALLGVGVLLAAAPWHLLRHPVGVRAAAANPGWRDQPRDWVALAAGVEAPGGFRPFEPVLEEVAGAAPLTHHRVSFHALPRGSAGEVGSYAGRRIDLYGTAPYDKKDHSYLCPEVRACGDVDLCRDAEGPARGAAGGGAGGEPGGAASGPSAASGRGAGGGRGEVAGRTDWIRGRNVARWVHEQGHFYEGFPRGWGRDAQRHFVSETAATALVFAFAEHLGHDFSPELAANLLLSQLVPVEGNTRFELSPGSRRDLIHGFIDLPDDDAIIERLAAAAVLVLRASGLGSFRDVWRYAHERSPAEVAGRVRRHAGRLTEGFQLTVDLALALQGRPSPGFTPVAAPAVVDAAGLGPLQGIVRDECLEVWYQHHVLAFCGRGRDARVDVTTVDQRRLVARLAREDRDVCVLATDPAGPAGKVFVYEQGEASLRTTAAMATPCACRSVATPLPRAAGAAALGEATARLQAIIQRGLADLESAGAPVERAFAHDVVARLAAALPPGARGGRPALHARR